MIESALDLRFDLVSDNRPACRVPKYMTDWLLSQLGRFLVIAGVVLVALGLLVMGGAKVSFFGLGRLPGDIAYKGKSVTFYFPIVTSLVLSGVLTIVFWIISFFTRH